MHKLNKKSQTAFIMIFVIAIILVPMALYTMATFTNDLNFQSKDISQLSYELELNHQYVLAQSKILAKQTLSKCISCSPTALKQKFIELSAEKENLFRYEGSGNFYGKIRNGNFTVKDNQIILEDLFVESEIKENKIRREFNITISL
jgi:hypothetical protein